MSRKTRAPLADRVGSAAASALAANNSVSAVDMLVGIGWLDPGAVERWRRGQVDCLESLIRTNPARLWEAMTLFRSWVEANGLAATDAPYVDRTSRRQPLRFSAGGVEEVERAYRTHWISPALPEKQRERVMEKAARPPELVVIQPLKADWTCHLCGGTGDLLMMEEPGPACLPCAGLDNLDFLPAGDALLTRRVKAKSARYAVVVRFSRSRGRYERQGLLVEPEALATVRRDLEPR